MKTTKDKLKTYKLFFSSLSNPNRLQIINVLKSGRKNVSKICEITGFEQTTISHNLKRLEHCGMVFAEQKGRQRYYSLNNQTIKPLLKLINMHMHKYCAKHTKTKITKKQTKNHLKKHTRR